MNNRPEKLEIISHPLCPFAQRLRITLLEKGLVDGADFQMNYVDLTNLPDWFLEVSPKTSMPILRTETAILFKTIAINEYLDEITPGSLHPENALTRAQHRAWIEFAAQPLTDLRMVYMAKDESGLEKSRATLFKKLQEIESMLTENGASSHSDSLSLLDAAFAPLFCLLLEFSYLKEALDWNHLPNTRAWAETLLNHPSVQKARCENYRAEFMKFFNHFGSYFKTHI